MKPSILYYVDHTSRFHYNSGVQRCVRALARALIELGQPLLPVVWNRATKRLQPADPQALRHLARWRGPDTDSWGPWPDASGSLRGSWLLIVELVSGPHNPSREELRAATEPLGLRLAWLFHDAIPVRWAQLYGTQSSQAASCHAQYMAALASYERVFCNSHTSRQHLLEFLEQQGLARPQDLQERITALPLAEQFGTTRPATAPGSRDGRMRLLCVSTLEPRKNHRNLLKALSWLHSQGLQNWQLDLVGWAADSHVERQIARARASGLPIHWHQRVDDDALERLYQACDCTVYPSLEEGFGLPVAESLWQRRPCLCSGDGALGERAAGGGCLTVDTANWRAICSGLQRLISDPELRRSLTEASDQRHFRTWQEVAEELMSHLNTSGRTR